MNMFLNEEQQQIARHHDGPCIVTAVAGSGKTTAIVSNLQNKLMMGIPARNIIATTFTKDAAENIRRRIEKCMNTKIQENTLIGTSHSFGYRILREKQRSKQRLLCPEAGKIYWEMKKVLGQHILSPKYPDVEDDYLRKFSYLKNRKMFPISSPRMDELGFLANYEDTDRWANTLTKGMTPDTIHVAWVAYEKFKSANCLIDFDDMLIMPYVLLATNEAVRKQYQEQVKYLIIDEYQDTNEPQYEFYKLLAAPENNIIVVGDDDQAIYSFRGAYPKYIRQFIYDYPGCQMHRLEKNYRSQGGVLDTANKLIVNNTDRYEKQLVCTKDGQSSKPKILEFADQITEAEFVIAIVAKWQDERIPLNEIAIITRTNNQLGPFESRLIDKGIPYIMVNNNSFFEKQEVKAFIHYIKIAVNPHDAFDSIKAVANMPVRYISKEKMKQYKSYREMRQSNDFQINQYCQELESLSLAYVKMNTIADGEQIKHSILGNHILTGPIGLLKWSEYQSSRGDGDDNPKDNLLQAYDMMVYSTGVLDIVDKFEKAKHTAKNKDDGVVLTTIHRAKGLEWDYVFVPGCCDGILPHGKTDNMQEERRLMYVAVTRARKILFLSHFTYRGNNAYDPSRFLKEMGDTVEHISFVKER